MRKNGQLRQRAGLAAGLRVHLDVYLSSMRCYSGQAAHFSDLAVNWLQQ
jgi:hypothetical protein